MKPSPLATSAYGEQLDSGRDGQMPVRGRLELRDGSLEHLFEHDRVRVISTPIAFSLIVATKSVSLHINQRIGTTRADLMAGECLLIPPNTAKDLSVERRIEGTYLIEVPSNVINRFLQPVVLCKIWHPIHDAHLSAMAGWLIQSSGLHSAPFEEYRNALLVSLAARLSVLMSLEGEALSMIGQRHRAVLDRVMEILQSDPRHEMTVDEIAAQVGLSGSQLNRIFQRAVGQPVHRYRMDVRLDQANRALRGTKFPIARIAFDCGFNDAAHLCKCYKNRFGVSPGAIRRALKNSDSAD